jgi:hypothetical protein
MESSEKIDFLDLFSNYQITTFLGQGCFGKIHKIKSDNTVFALKKVKIMIINEITNNS